MNSNPPFSPWHYVTLLPSGFALLGGSVATLSRVQQWGNDPRISTVITVFFCEVLMVISAFGALAYIKQPHKRRFSSQIFALNMIYIVTAFFTGLYLFLS